MSEENGRTDLTWRELLDEGGARLSEAGVPDAGTDAWYLMEAAFGIDRVHYYLDQNRPIHAERLEKGYGRYQEMLQKRAERIPLQQILGMQDFMGMTFSVDENVLIPRQDTETLVERVLRDYPEKDLKLLDMCTGSGCIAISLAVKGGYESVTATDLSEEALKVAERNAKTHQKKIIFRQGDLFSALPRTEAGTFDIITSNPPYIPTAVIATLEPEVREHEPMMALDGTEDGLRFYRQIAQEAGTWLKPGGAIYLEIGYDQGEAVSGLLREAGFDKVRVVKDLPGKDRVVCGVWPG